VLVEIAPAAVLPPRLTTDGEFIAAAAQFAAYLSDGAPTRDREGRLPTEELAALRETGLLGLPVPREFGGAGVSRATIVEVFVALAAADPAFAQIIQPHTSFLEIVAGNGDDEQRRRFFTEALAGQRFGNALSERGTAHVWEYRTRLTREGAAPGTRLLTGTKYYSTGALSADWIGVFAVDDGGVPAVAYVPGDAPGVEVSQDWTAFGQRATISGTTTLDRVVVPEENIVEFAGGAGAPVPTLSGTYAQLVHAAIDVGIAGGALADGIAFVRRRGRPYPAAGVERAAQEQGVQQHYGRLATLVDAATELLRRAAERFDLAAADSSDADTVDAARLAVAKAKAYAGDVALEVTSAIFDGAGASATDRGVGLDRHWRNARTHTLHDPNRWKYIHVGAWLLTDTPPDPRNHLI
jgi:SfnB family sulfur acquisition oxidoreductase